MASARWGRDDRGRVVVYVQGNIDGERVEIRRIVPRNDETLAQRAVEAHQARFLTGDLQVLADALRSRRAKKLRGRKSLFRSPKALPIGLTVAEWHDQWLKSLRGTIGEHTWRSYRSATKTLLPRIGNRSMAELSVADLIKLRAELLRSGLAEATVADKMGYLRRMLRDAVLAGHLDQNPLEIPLPTRRTKENRRQRTRRVAKRPLTADQLTALLNVCQDPRTNRPAELQWFPLTEALLLTGLRWGEAAAWMWAIVGADKMRIERAIEQ